MPKRVQMSRQHPWRAENPDAVIVARPSRWGNPYAVKRVDDVWPWQVMDRIGVVWGQYGTKRLAVERAVYLHRIDAEGWSALTVECVRHLLTGRDLACWCKPGNPCHADALLELANGGDS